MVKKYKCIACKECRNNYKKIYGVSKSDGSYYRFVVVKRFKDIKWD